MYINNDHRDWYIPVVQKEMDKPMEHTVPDVNEGSIPANDLLLFPDIEPAEIFDAMDDSFQADDLLLFQNLLAEEPILFDNSIPTSNSVPAEDLSATQSSIPVENSIPANDLFQFQNLLVQEPIMFDNSISVDDFISKDFLAQKPISIDNSISVDDFISKDFLAKKPISIDNSIPVGDLAPKESLVTSLEPVPVDSSIAISDLPPKEGLTGAQESIPVDDSIQITDSHGQVSKVINDPCKTAEAIKIRSIIEQYRGVFKFSPDFKLFCDYCHMELNEHQEVHVKEHLNSEKHLEIAKSLKSKKESQAKLKQNRNMAYITQELVVVSDDEDELDTEQNKVNLVMKAFDEGIFTNQKFDKIYCSLCDKDIQDSLLLLKKHLKDGEHVKNELRQLKCLPTKTIDIVQNDPLLEFNDQNLVHCKWCKKMMQASSYTLTRHCSSPFHQEGIKDENENLDEKLSEKEKLEKLLNQHSNHLRLKYKRIFCKPCKQLILARCRNVIQHLSRFDHSRKVSQFDKNMSVVNSNKTKIIKVKRIIQQQHETAKTIEAERRKLDRLLLANNYFDPKNDGQYLLCKPCDKMILSSYMNVLNHIRRKCHLTKLPLYQQKHPPPPQQQQQPKLPQQQQQLDQLVTTEPIVEQSEQNPLHILEPVTEN